MKSIIYQWLKIIILTCITPTILYAQADSFKIVKSVTPIVNGLKSDTNEEIKTNSLNKVVSENDFVISFRGASEGYFELLHNTYPDDIWQKMEWELLETNFTIEANFSEQNDDILSFMIVKKDGVINFKGTATQHDFGGTYNFNFDRTSNIEYDNIEGKLLYSMAKKEIIYLDFAIVPSDSYPSFEKIVFDGEDINVKIKMPPNNGWAFTGDFSYFSIPEPVFDLGDQFPSANFTYTFDVLKTDKNITFDASSSGDPDGGIPYYLATQWDFGDGATNTGKKVEHSYNAPGEYNVCLTIIDIHNLRDKICKKITIEQSPRPPVAKFYYSPEDPSINDSITFDASESFDPDPNGNIVSYRWDFGNGESSSDKTMKIKYDEIATYWVQLIVLDDTGLKDTTTRIIDFTNDFVSLSGFVHDVRMDNNGNLIYDYNIINALVELYENNNLVKSTRTGVDGEFIFNQTYPNQKYELRISAKDMVNQSEDSVEVVKIVNDIIPSESHYDFTIPIGLTVQKYKLLYDLEHLKIKIDIPESIIPPIPLFRSYDESQVASLIEFWTENITINQKKNTEAIARLFIAEQVLDSLFEDASITTHYMSKGVYDFATAFLGYFDMFNLAKKKLPSASDVHTSAILNYDLYPAIDRLIFDYFISGTANMIEAALPKEYGGGVKEAINLIKQYIISETGGKDFVTYILEKGFETAVIGAIDELFLSMYYVPVTQNYVNISTNNAQGNFNVNNLSAAYSASFEVIKASDDGTNKAVERAKTLQDMGEALEKMSDAFQLPPLTPVLMILDAISLSIRNFAVTLYGTSTLITGWWVNQIATVGVPVGTARAFEPGTKNATIQQVLTVNGYNPYEKTETYKSKHLNNFQNNLKQSHQNYLDALNLFVGYTKNNLRVEAIDMIPELLSYDELLSETYLLAQGPIYATAAEAYLKRENFAEQYNLLGATLTESLGERIYLYMHFINYILDDFYSADSLSIQAERIKTKLDEVELTIDETISLIADIEAPPLVLIKKHSIDSSFVKPGVAFELNATIQNMGALDADSVIIELIADSITSVVSDEKFNIANLNVNESLDLTWLLQVNDTIQQLGSYLIKVTVLNGKGLSSNGFFSIENEGKETATATKNILLKPARNILYQNFPNPFKELTTIKYKLSVKTNVKLEIIDIYGRQVKLLLNKIQDAGIHNIEWDGTDNHGVELINGVYLYKITTDNEIHSNRMLLMR